MTEMLSTPTDIKARMMVSFIAVKYMRFVQRSTLKPFFTGAVITRYARCYFKPYEPSGAVRASLVAVIVLALGIGTNPVNSNVRHVL